MRDYEDNKSESMIEVADISEISITENLIESVRSLGRLSVLDFLAWFASFMDIKSVYLHSCKLNTDISECIGNIKGL